MLKVEAVNVFYQDLQALWDISLTADAGEIVALVGSNGAGKSTLLKTISGLLPPVRGQVFFNETRIDKLPQHRVVDLGVSLVPEGRRLFKEMSVLENLELGAFLPQARVRKQANLAWVFQLFPVLEARTGQMAGTLSGGEQQMLAIARGLMSEPRLLLLDEMSLGLAPLIVGNLYQIIKDINKTRGLTIFLVEQNVRYALETAHRAYIIESGHLVGQGAAQDLLHSEEVKKAYLSVA